MSLLNQKNQYLASGVIKSIDAVDIRPYKSKATGEDMEWKTRKFVIRNKYSKNGTWHITDIEFEAVRDAADGLDELMPGLEVHVSFSIRSSAYARDGKDRYWMVLEAWNIMTLKDKPVDVEWWLPQNKQRVKKGTEYEAPPSLAVQNKKERMPNNKSYKYDSFNPGSDYSDKKEEEDDLPF